VKPKLCHLLLLSLFVVVYSTDVDNVETDDEDVEHTLEFMAHSVDLLDISKHHFCVYPVVIYPAIHVIRRQKIRDTRESFSIDL
jgi:hypothetical protein